MVPEISSSAPVVSRASVDFASRSVFCQMSARANFSQKSQRISPARATSQRLGIKLSLIWRILLLMFVSSGRAVLFSA